MNRKFIYTPILILLITLFITSPVLAAKSYFAELYEVNVAVQQDGTLQVEETVHFRFDGGPFTFVFRELAFNNLDSIDQIQVSMDGQVLPEGSGAGQVEIEAGRPLKVTWNFPPTSDSSHAFALSYRVQGAIRQESAVDTLIWRAIPEDHDYDIQRSVITIQYPPGVAPLVTPSIDRRDAQIEESGNAITFTTGAVDEDEALDVTVQFPPASLVSRPPAWQAAQQQRTEQNRAALPYGLTAAGITGLLGAALIFVMSRGLRRDDAEYGAGSASYTSPPASIAPALAARMTGSGSNYLGTLFDLARRGFLRIEEGPKKWSGRSFEIVRLPNAGGLAQHEQAFIDALFHKAPSDRVDLSKIASVAYHSPFTSALDEELENMGLRDPERSNRRTWFVAWMVIAMVVGVVMLLAGVIMTGNLQPAGTLLAIAPVMLVGAGAALTIISIVGLIIALLTSPLTQEGARQAASWTSFTNHLRDITRGREAAAGGDLFDRYLPYAAAFGLATAWGKFFQKMNIGGVPEWFHGAQAGMDDGSFVAIMAAITSADSSASSAASGGGGASGGGSSGAG